MLYGGRKHVTYLEHKRVNFLSDAFNIEIFSIDL